ncbi:MAG: hypothetical protein LAP87_12115 [Acidobacteriia bacterium]|nr:hypothetical protein [Terriglobia bacterium]
MKRRAKVRRTVTKKSPPPRKLQAAVSAAPIRLWGLWLLGALFVALALYSPALNGKLVFDDIPLPLHLKSLRQLILQTWLAGSRPVLMTSYFLNYWLWGEGTFSYHVLNVAIHAVNTGLVCLILLRLLGKAGWAKSKATAASIIGAGIFLVHPLQTESVSYIAGRSESLATMFALLAYAVCLYRRRESISWLEAVAVLALFGLGVKTKENVVSLAGILVLTDVFWPAPFTLEGLRKNRRLYLLMIPGAAGAAIAIFRLLSRSATAGFSAAMFTWYQYLFTEARVLFLYVRLAIIPVGQSIDHDYVPSRTVTEHGAIVYMLLLAALVALSVLWRRRYPLFCFGLLWFLIWLAPTSSVVPLDDAIVERRMYGALIGLIFIGCEIASRVRLPRATGYGIMAAVVVGFGILCYQRNQLWGDPDRLLALAAFESTHNPRPLLNFAEALDERNRCDLAIPYLRRAELMAPNSYYVHAMWGRTLSCLGHYPEALQRLQLAAALQPTSQVWEWIGLTYGQLGMSDEAGKALQKAVKLNRDSESAHGSLALWYEKMNNLAMAEQEYEITVSLDFSDTWAKAGLMRVHQLRAARGQQ